MTSYAPSIAAYAPNHTEPMDIFYEMSGRGEGANFAVAETGSIVVSTNEGNADICFHLPNLFIASVGIEKIIPRHEHLAVLVRMLSRSALGRRAPCSPIPILSNGCSGSCRSHPSFHRLLVEIDSSELAYDFAQIREIVRALGGHGIGISIDNLGAECSSLLGLEGCPIAEPVRHTSNGDLCCRQAALPCHSR